MERPYLLCSGRGAPGRGHGQYSAPSQYGTGLAGASGGMMWEDRRGPGKGSGRRAGYANKSVAGTKNTMSRLWDRLCI